MRPVPTNVKSWEAAAGLAQLAAFTGVPLAAVPWTVTQRLVLPFHLIWRPVGVGDADEEEELEDGVVPGPTYQTRYV